ncbi:MAG: DMT family transporter [Acidimicrobiales bacterium]|nr:DMT family transporter [Acidimicrobiales bacterium]
MKARRTEGELAALAVIWGASFLFIKVALEGLSPTQIVAGRLVTGALVLAVAVSFGVARYPRGWWEWRVVILMSLISNVVPFALFAWGEERVTSSLASVLNATTPLWTAGLAAAALLPGERLNIRRVTGLLAGMAGVVIIVEPWRSGGGEVLGELACVGAAACYGIGFVFTSRYITGKIPSITAAVGQITAGAVMASAIALVTTIASDAPTRVDFGIGASVVALGTLGTGVAYLFFFHLIETSGPTAASTVTFAMPFVGVLLGVLVLDEGVGWNVAVGGAVVIAGIVTVRRRVVIEEPLEVGAP